MKPDDLANATARALDLLPPDDPARSDPRLARDPRLTEESRLTREAAADVWLAVSPLHVAPPEILQAVLEEIRPPAARTSRTLPWLAASGWAAAALIAFLLWPKNDVTRQDSAELGPVRQPRIGRDSSFPAGAPSDSLRVRREIGRLQERLAAVGKASVPVPRVIGLHAPGAPRRTAEESRERVQSILTAALRSALEAESGAPGDPAELVIERGWPVAADDEIIRHRHFPESSWQELGLLRSANGQYYDPATRTVWWPDAEGKSFLGRKSTDHEDLAGFTARPDLPAATSVKPRTAPEGFVIENPEMHSAEVVIDQVPAPEPGNERVIILKDPRGRTTTLPLQGTAVESGQPHSASMGSGSSDFVQFLGGDLTTGTMVFTLLGTNGVANFQLVERPVGSTGTGGRIIVEGGP